MESLVPDLLSGRLSRALETLGGAEVPVHVVASADRRFGDYQTNVAMALAKTLKRNPKQIAEEIVSRVEVGDICSRVEVAGAGFINFRLSDEFLAGRLAWLSADPACGLVPSAHPMRVVLDFSAPNVAKPMHVGHIRSTILGDALARIARALGHEVVTDNHIGDWGTQFGKVIYGWKHLLDREALVRKPVDELVRLYREVNALSEQDPAVLEACRQELVRLQSGDPDNLAIWRQAVELSSREFETIYERLGIRFDETLGESFYNDRLGPLCDRLERMGIATLSEGALCVFFPDDAELADKPCLIRKSDGGFLYATTDLATLEYRMERWAPDAIWYVTGAPQILHFRQIFAVAARLGITAHLEHIAFGSILGEDRKLMKTRSGDNVQLADVLDEAVERALAMVRAKTPDMPEEEARNIATVIGIGAVKYAELSQHRMTDYVFSWDKMLSLQGNTAPYLQNAYVRIQSIFRKAGLDADKPHSDAAGYGQIGALHEAERDLACCLLRFGEAVTAVLEDFRPNLLANYLYELATTFHAFYEACPVLKSDGPTRALRMTLCRLTGRTLHNGLDLLGIGVPERM